MEKTRHLVNYRTPCYATRMFCTVVTAPRQAGIMNGLTYDSGSHAVQPGSLVRVPLRNKLVEGIVVAVSDTRTETYDLKQIHDVIGSPLLPQPYVQLIHWMADTYLTTLRHVLAVSLPTPPWSKLVPKPVSVFLRTHAEPSVTGKKQQIILEYLLGRDDVTLAELRSHCDATPAMIKALLAKGLIQEEIRQDVKPVFILHNNLKALPVLTPLQQDVESAIRKDPRPSLLFGVTGSGKTEIYAQMIADTLKARKQSLVLVPEILLTEHSITRYEALVNRSAIAILHSRLTPAERRKLWLKIRDGEIAIVLGSRSALFAPLPNLGLVIIDEEHEWTYKNEQTPRYHARETAEALCAFAKAKLVLGSATPSLETWQRAKNGQYQLERLPMRYREQAMPNVRIVDLATVDFGKMYPFSPPLLDAIEDRLRKREQSVLFLNRRGIATSVLCLECRRRIVSPESQLPFTVHTNAQGRPYLMDHTNGLLAEMPRVCPHCQSPKLLAVGAGTQKVEHILKQKFPEARLIRADADTISEPEQMRQLLSTMREGKADILLGTQSVVKGLDLPEVTLAAVVLADVGLSLPHFRAGERIFQLLTQLTGRSGRAKMGEVIIQTFRPNALEIVAAARHETEQYLDQELKLRAYTNYPPLSGMIRLILRDDDPALRARKLTGTLQAVVEKQGLKLTVSSAPTFFGGGREWHILVRGEHPRELIKQVSMEDVVIDVDPVETI